MNESIRYFLKYIKDRDIPYNRENFKEYKTFSLQPVLKKAYGADISNKMEIWRQNYKIAEIVYNPDVNFDYCTFSEATGQRESMNTDAINTIVNNLINCKTFYSVMISSFPENLSYFNSHFFRYTIGDMIIGYKDSPGFDGLPIEKAVGALPIKFDIMEVI